MAATPKPRRKVTKALAKIHREFPMVIEGSKKKTPSAKAMKVAKSHHKKHDGEHHMGKKSHKKSMGLY